VSKDSAEKNRIIFSTTDDNFFLSLVFVPAVAGEIGMLLGHEEARLDESHGMSCNYLVQENFG
jgi:hypothetical protein